MSDLSPDLPPSDTPPDTAPATGAGKALDRLAGFFTILACLVVLAMMLHVCADIIMRGVFNAPLFGTTEIVSAYYMVALAFLPIAWISRMRGHIIVELFTSHLAPRRVRLIDGLAGIVTLIYVGTFCWQVIHTALEKTRIREAWESASGQIQIWPSRWLIPAGFGVMLAYVAIHLMQDLRAARRPDTVPPAPHQTGDGS